MGCRVLNGGIIIRHLRVRFSDYASTVMVLSLSVVLLTTCLSCVLVTDTLFKYSGQIKLLLIRSIIIIGESLTKFVHSLRAKIFYCAGTVCVSVGLAVGVFCIASVRYHLPSSFNWTVRCNPIGYSWIIDISMSLTLLESATVDI